MHRNIATNQQGRRQKQWQLLRRFPPCRNQRRRRFGRRLEVEILSTRGGQLLYQRHFSGGKMVAWVGDEANMQRVRSIQIDYGFSYPYPNFRDGKLTLPVINRTGKPFYVQLDPSDYDITVDWRGRLSIARKQGPNAVYLAGNALDTTVDVAAP